MKLKSTIQFFLLIFYINLKAQSITQFRQRDSIVTGSGCSRGFYKDYTFKPKDIESYKHIEANFGKDRFHVYFTGKALSLINPDKLEMIYARDSDANESYKSYNNLFLTDGKFTYYNNVLVKNIDVKNIFYIADNRIPIFKSNNNIYFEGHLLDKLNANKTVVIDAHPNEKTNFFTDGKNIYNNEKLIENVDVKSFKPYDGYNEKNLITGIQETTADSHDDKNFYLNGKKIKLYPDWKKLKLFQDSLYDDKHMVTFTSRYQTHDVNAKNVINFYLSKDDFLQFTKNIILKRKTTYSLEKDAFLEDLKGYEINVYTNNKIQTTYYFAQDLEELDIKNFTQINVIGDGFHFNKKDFNQIRQKGKPIKYLEYTLNDYKSWTNKIDELNKNTDLIYHNSYSYYLATNEKNGKQKEIICKFLFENSNKPNKFPDFEGMFTFKITKQEIAEMLKKDINDFTRSNIEVELKKKKIIASIYGNDNYYVEKNYNTIYDGKEEFIIFDIYCSEDFIQKTLKKYVQNNWEKLRYKINTAEK